MRPTLGLQGYLAHLAALFPKVGLDVTPPPAGRPGPARGLRADARLNLTLEGKTTRLLVEVKRTHLAVPVAQALVGALGVRAPQWILFAPHIGRPLGRLMAAHGLNYVDLHGNCHLQIEGRLAAHIEGRTTVGAEHRPKGVRAPAVRVLFTLLADPDRLAATGRELARAAGTTHPTAIGVLRRLEEARAIVIDGSDRRWLPGGRRRALELWIEQYEQILRPALVMGRYRTPAKTPLDLEARITADTPVGERVWFGGAAAAFRVAPHHRGVTTVVHMGIGGERLLPLLHAVPDPQGDLLVLGLPGPLATRGRTPDTVHPLLVYAEMLHDADDRMLEAAQQLRERTLADYA